MADVTVYASLDQLAAVLIKSAGSLDTDHRAMLALAAGSRAVDARLGVTVTLTPEPAPYVLAVEDADPLVNQATLAAAVRFYRSTDVPFGAVGGMGDVAVYVRSRLPEVDLILAPLTTAGGAGIGIG